MPTVFKSSIYPFITIEFIFILGIVSVLLFSFFGILILKRIFQQKAGLILSEKGIFDNSSATFADLDLVDEYLKSKGK